MTRFIRIPKNRIGSEAWNWSSLFSTSCWHAFRETNYTLLISSWTNLILDETPPRLLATWWARASMGDENGVVRWMHIVRGFRVWHAENGLDSDYRIVGFRFRAKNHHHRCGVSDLPLGGPGWFQTSWYHNVRVRSKASKGFSRGVIIHCNHHIFIFFLSSTLDKNACMDALLPLL